MMQDHHCIWINNCVGHRNYKPFLVLIFYATVASTYSAVSLVRSFVILFFQFGLADVISFPFSDYDHKLCTSEGLEF